MTNLSSFLEAIVRNGMVLVFDSVLRIPVKMRDIEDSTGQT